MTEPMIPVDAIDSPRSAFACCSRSGLTVIGVKPVEAGLKNALAVPEIAWRTTISQICALCVRISIATPPCVPKRTTSAVSITARRGSRSAKTPPMRRKPTSGTAFAAKT